MSDVPAQGFPVLWKVSAPKNIGENGIFTVVAKLDGRVEPEVAEAFLVTPQGDNIREKFEGISVHTVAGFNNDTSDSTYVWFNITARVRGKQEYKVRLSWSAGRHLFGNVKIFPVKVHREFTMPSYCRCISLSR